MVGRGIGNHEGHQSLLIRRTEGGEGSGEPDPKAPDQTLPPTEEAVLLALEIAEAVRVPPLRIVTS